MKKTCLLTLMAVALFGMLPSCKPTDDPSHLTDQVKVITAEPTSIAARTATCGAEVTAENPGLLLELGVCWSTSPNPTVDNFVKKTNKCSVPYSCKLTNLEPNTQYYVRGFAKYGTEYCYGSELTFTTLDGGEEYSPVTTPPAHDITYNGFVCDIMVEPFGVSNFSVGICYSQNPEFTFADCERYELGFFNGTAYIASCHSLRPNTQYYYRAYLALPDESIGQNIYFYGDILSFTTPDTPLVIDLITYIPHYYHYTSNYRYIVVPGEINCNKPEVLNEVGVCYSYTNEYPIYESDLHVVTIASPTGEWYGFDAHIENISANRKYYVRTYARYMTDSVKYGNTESIDIR